MMSKVLLFIANLFIISQCAENSELAAGSNSFGYELSDELYESSTNNIWISPFCITSCFALIYPGTAGQTQTQIANVMGYPTDSTPTQVTQQFFTLQTSIEETYDGQKENQYDPKPTIIGIANKVYVSKLLTLKQSYISALNNGPLSFIEHDFDFSAVNATKIINKWVSDNTNGLIDGVLDENTDLSDWRLAALNAIYLNGSFASPFQPESTSLTKFYASGLRETERTDIHLMHQIDYFEYSTDGNYQYLKFPFSDLTDLFVLFALPINSDVYDTQNGLITDENVIKAAIENLTRTYVALALPKLSIEEKYDLNVPLQDMGMTDAFDPNLADFSGMADGVDLFIDTVIHKTMIEMDEEGLVAAAVTVIGVSITSIIIHPEPILFKADHPYQMFIIDGAHDNAILFMGQINEPGIPEGSEVSATFNESDNPVWTQYDLYQHSNSTDMMSTTQMEDVIMDTTEVEDMDDKAIEMVILSSVVFTFLAAITV